MKKTLAGIVISFLISTFIAGMVSAQPDTGFCSEPDAVGCEPPETCLDPSGCEPDDPGNIENPDHPCIDDPSLCVGEAVFSVSVTDVSVNPVVAGETTKIDYRVENVGDVSGSDTVSVEAVMGGETKDLGSSLLTLDSGEVYTGAKLFEPGSGDAGGADTIRGEFDSLSGKSGAETH